MEPGTSLRALLEGYRDWYVAAYLPTLRVKGYPEADLAKLGWLDPLSLSPVRDEEVRGLEAEVGPLPSAYRELLKVVGVGTLLCAYDEPIPYHVVAPRQLADVRRDAFSWLGADDARASVAAGLDPARMLPFFHDDGAGFYAVLTRQHDDDDGVVLFDHAYEQGYPFGPRRSLREFFERFIAGAKAAKPLSPYEDRIAGPALPQI